MTSGEFDTVKLQFVGARSHNAKTDETRGK
jgi:hypothetical protein